MKLSETRGCLQVAVWIKEARAPRGLGFGGGAVRPSLSTSETVDFTSRWAVPSLNREWAKEEEE